MLAKPILSHFLFSTNHAYIRKLETLDSNGCTAADMARTYGHYALASYGGV